MKSALLAVAALLATWAPAPAIDLRQRSESKSKQFVVYSEDVRLRQSVAAFAEEVKSDMLQLFGVSDRWRAPIVITLARPTTEELSRPPASLRLVETQPGFKIEITIKVGDNPAAVDLRRHLLRAVLLEYAYRETGVIGGAAYVEPPWWVVEGLVEMGNQTEAGVRSDLFRRLIETNKLPPIEHFLVRKPDELGPTALAVDRALALALLQLLTEQPGGRSNLTRLLRAWPESNGDPVALLPSQFPSIAEGRQTLQKWWTLNVARFAAADRYQAQAAEETEAALDRLLQFELVINKEGEKKTFAIGDFEQYRKLPASREVLAARHNEMVALGTKANMLLRPVVGDYEQVFALLARGKTRGVRERLAKADEYRRLVVRRTGDIADYLNWFEATQMGARSHAFDNYLRIADEIAEQDRKQRTPIGNYLDVLEQDF